MRYEHRNVHIHEVSDRINSAVTQGWKLVSVSPYLGQHGKTVTEKCLIIFSADDSVRGLP